MHANQTERIVLISVNCKLFSKVDSIGVGSIASYLYANGYETLLMSSLAADIEYDTIIKFCPTIVGLNMFNKTFMDVLCVCKQIKQLMPSIKIVVGGRLVSSNGKEILSLCPDIDFLIKGEGEVTFLELVQNIRNPGHYEKINGILYKDATTEIIETTDRRLITDLDAMPFPDRRILRQNNLGSAYILGSRGCTKKCSFCGAPTFWKNGACWRGRSICNIVDEMQQIKECYGILRFNFIDNSFEDPGTNLQRMEDFANELINRDLKIAFFIYLRAEFARIATDDIIKKLKQAGLAGVHVGIESAYKDDLELFNKAASIEDNVNIVELFHRHDVFTAIGFINFHPYTSVESLQINSSFLYTYRFASNFFYFLRELEVNEGTTIYSELKKTNFLREHKFYEPINYTYRNEKIALLHTYLIRYFTYRKKEDAWRDMQYFVRYGLEQAAYLNTIFHQYQDEQAIDIIRDYTEKLNYQLDILNELNYCWFNEIINDLYTERFEEQVFHQIDATLTEEQTIKISKALKQNKVLLMRNLVKLNKNYLKIVNDDIGL